MQHNPQRLSHPLTPGDEPTPTIGIARLEFHLQLSIGQHHAVAQQARDVAEGAFRRDEQIGLDQLFPGATNPFPWMSELIDLKKEKNFFETRVTEYQTGGSLTWEKPQHMASFTADGPFAGLQVPKDVTVNRQVLAEPDAVRAFATGLHPIGRLGTPRDIADAFVYLGSDEAAEQAGRHAGQGVSNRHAEHVSQRECKAAGVRKMFAVRHQDARQNRNHRKHAGRKGEQQTKAEKARHQRKESALEQIGNQRAEVVKSDTEGEARVAQMQGASVAKQEGEGGGYRDDDGNERGLYG